MNNQKASLRNKKNNMVKIKTSPYFQAITIVIIICFTILTGCINLKEKESTENAVVIKNEQQKNSISKDSFLKDKNSDSTAIEFKSKIPDTLPDIELVEKMKSSNFFSSFWVNMNYRTLERVRYNMVKDKKIEFQNTKKGNLSKSEYKYIFGCSNGNEIKSEPIEFYFQNDSLKIISFEIYDECVYNMYSKKYKLTGYKDTTVLVKCYDRKMCGSKSCEESYRENGFTGDTDIDTYFGEKKYQTKKLYYDKKIIKRGSHVVVISSVRRNMESRYDKRKGFNQPLSVDELEDRLRGKVNREIFGNVMEFGFKVEYIENEYYQDKLKLLKNSETMKNKSKQELHQKNLRDI